MLDKLSKWAKLKGPTAVVFMLLGGFIVWVYYRGEKARDELTAYDLILQRDLLDTQTGLANLEGRARGWDALNNTWYDRTENLEDKVDALEALAVRLETMMEAFAPF